MAFYRMSADHASIVNKTTGVVIVSPTITDAAFIAKGDASLDHIIEQYDATYDDQDVPSYKFAANIPDTLAFLEIARPRKAGGGGSSTRNEKFDENGIKIGGTSSGGGIPYLMVRAEFVSGTKIYTAVAIVTFKAASGARTTKNGDTVMVPFEVTAQACKKTGGFVADQALFDTGVWGTIPAADRTIPIDYYEKLSSPPKAA